MASDIFPCAMMAAVDERRSRAVSVGRLADYPRLAQWYQARAWEREPSAQRSLLGRVCELLESETPVSVAVSAFASFSDESQNPSDDWLAFETTLSDAGLSLGELLSRLCETSLRAPKPSADFLSTTARLASLTDSDALRFICAWLCLNTGDLEGCLTHCDLVTRPTSAVFALQGQAHLESGSVEKAIEDFQIAVRLAPNDVMFWFQLARACYVHRDMNQSWEALAKAARLDRHNPEIAHFMATVALASFATVPARATEAWNHLAPLIGTHGKIDVMALALINIAVRIKDEAEFTSLLHGLDCSELAKSTKLPSALAPILRILMERDWRQGTQLFLTRITPPSPPR